MYTRIQKIPNNKSFFLFGPRGTGKTTWLKTRFPNALYLDLLKSEIYNDLLARPELLADMIPDSNPELVIIDEVQRIPKLLYEVHRLIESRKLVFALTGSSARKLKRGEADMLAGRALTLFLYPLTSEELGDDFDLQKALTIGHLPSVSQEENPSAYLESYITTYLREEVQQEGLTRNLGAFSRFLEVASFSQAQVLNISAVARECAIHLKVAENYFSILDDLLIAERVPVFTKKAKRRMTNHFKFFYFDVGVYRTLRPKGPLDSPEEIDGAALETLFFQELRALNHYHRLGYKIYYWRSAAGQEVDFVLYGEKGIIALEIKRKKNYSDSDLRGLKAFAEDYPQAKCYLLCATRENEYKGNITIMPIEKALVGLKKILENNPE